MPQYVSKRTQEEQQLRGLLAKLLESRGYYEELYRTTEEELEQLHRMYTSATPEFYNDIPTKEFLAQLYRNRLTDCEKALEKPYFGKLIYQEKADELTLYIGKKGIANHKEQDEIWVVDWRAPVSALYYSGNLGRTQYRAAQRDVLVDLKLKTTLEIKNGKLLGFYDSEVVANDELLVKYLSQNKDVVLNEIVATIQKDQDAIIRRPLHVNVLVQGVAGSGKTTVALHRIAYLLYTYREKMSSENVFVLAANRLFLNYITAMLPDLEVPDVGQGTLRELLCDSIARCYPKLRFRLTQGASEYNQAELPAVLRGFLQEVKEAVFCGAVAAQGVPIQSARTVREQIDDLHEMSLLRMAQLMDKRLWSFYKNRCDAFAFPLHDAFFQQGITARADLLRAMQKEEKILQQYYRARLKKQKPQELLNELRKRLGLGAKRPNDYTADDLCLLVLLSNFLHDGCMREKIYQVVVDEAQDLNALQYLCLKSIFPDASFTVVGDIMQNIHSDSIESWQQLSELVFGGKTELATLLKSYRNTIEISDFAKEIVEEHSGEPFACDPLVRHGRAVVRRNPPKGQEIAQLTQTLAEIAQSGYGLNAVICKDTESAKQLYEEIRETAKVQWLDAESGTLEKGSYVLSVADAKGLEFDSVVIWDFGSYDIPAPTLDFKLLYVAATRALHELFVFDLDAGV